MSDNQPIRLFKSIFCCLAAKGLNSIFAVSLQFAFYLGPVGYVLSWHVWIPLGKLTFGAYLTHGVWMALYVYSQQQPVVMSSTTLVSSYYHNAVKLKLVFFCNYVHVQHCQHVISEAKTWCFIPKLSSANVNRIIKFTTSFHLLLLTSSDVYSYTGSVERCE